MPVHLPVDELIRPILDSLKKHRNLVLEAAPGAGKTTRVPPALLALTNKEVWVLEPRRIAARMAARRVASEMGETVGQTVGYQVRFEEVAGPKTRLRFLTEGVLTRRMHSDTKLSSAGIVVLDEFHERHMDADLALALLLNLQCTVRPDLQLLVMSATLDATPIAEHLECEVIRSEGRLFPLTERWTPYSNSRLDEQVASAVSSLEPSGDTLVFLPGAAEIRQAERAVAAIARSRNLLVLPLHGDLSPAEQDRAVEPASFQKLILSTNVAESSITIDGLTTVIDSGLARTAFDSPWTGIPELRVTRISQASVRQRAGRAARTGPGTVIHLYTGEDFARRPAQDVPELLRRELSQLLLDLDALHLDIDKLPWLAAPPSDHVKAARELLNRLGAFGPAGRKMARLPLPPRLAKLVVEAESRNAAYDGCRIAAALSAGERLNSRGHQAAPSDLLLLIDQDWQYRTRQTFEQVRRAAGVRDQRRAEAQRARRPPDELGTWEISTAAGAPFCASSLNDEALLVATLAAFPDRLAVRKKTGEYTLAGGGSARLAAESALEGEALIVAVDVEERKDKGLPLIRLASKVQPEWLIDLFPDQIVETSGLEWNKSEERVEARSSLVFDGLTIEESRSGEVDAENAARLLSTKALEAGMPRFVGEDIWHGLRARLSFASVHLSLPPMDDDFLRPLIEKCAYGLKSFSELKSVLADGGLLRTVLQGFPNDVARRFEDFAPERLRLPSGRTAKVEYADGQPPWVASRLQDFFGLKETPRVAGGRVPVVVHLLAPNKRPVQMTSDLAGFWQRLYPEVRRELSRRYPRHDWPEDPS